MEAKELRVGNLVKYSLSNIPQEIKSVISVHGEYVVNFQNSEFSNKIDKIKPIPLTEEWLLKFGFVDFEKGDMSYYIENNGEIVFKKSALDILYDYPIQYVHQLQNLFFALAGEELSLIK